jgi:hypothetical protein
MIIAETKELHASFGCYLFACSMAVFGAWELVRQSPDAVTPGN